MAAVFRCPGYNRNYGPRINYLTLQTKDNGGGHCGLNVDVWIKAQARSITASMNSKYSELLKNISDQSSTNQTASPETA
jgi:hypothetical protein